MRFEVPQFIDIEDKIFGPLTFKQFVYVGGGTGLSVVLWLFFFLLVAIPFILIVGGFSLALAFYRFNEKPFITFVESATKYLISKKLYIWKKELHPVSADETTRPMDETALSVPRLSDSKLRDLAWSLDVQDSIYSEQQ